MTRKKCGASSRATRCHIACVCGKPCSNKSGGLSFAPPKRAKIVVPLTANSRDSNPSNQIIDPPPPCGLRCCEPSGRPCGSRLPLLQVLQQALHGVVHRLAPHRGPVAVAAPRLARPAAVG